MYNLLPEQILLIEIPRVSRFGILNQSKNYANMSNSLYFFYLFNSTSARHRFDPSAERNFLVSFTAENFSLPSPRNNQRFLKGSGLKDC